jgi:hypothetical protein
MRIVSRDGDSGLDVQLIAKAVGRRGLSALSTIVLLGAYCAWLVLQYMHPLRDGCSIRHADHLQFGQSSCAGGQ